MIERSVQIKQTQCGEPTGPEADVFVNIGPTSINLILGTDDDDADEEGCMDLFIEWQKEDGWVLNTTQPDGTSTRTVLRDLKENN